jgi:urease accessory protein
LFPDTESGDPPVAVLLTTSGGLTGGDRVRLDVSVEPGAAACVTTQAAEKLYRALGAETSIEVDLAVAGGATLEYLPQETILFDGSCLDRRLRADVATDGRLIAAEMLVFGRTARGERLRRGGLYDGWRIRHGGRLVWADALALEGDIATRLADPCAFGGAEALATALYVGPDAGLLLPHARELADGAASFVSGVLVARLFGAPAQQVRSRLVRYLTGLREAAGLSAGLPRMWFS